MLDVCFDNNTSRIEALENHTIAKIYSGERLSRWRSWCSGTPALVIQSYEALCGRRYTRRSREVRRGNRGAKVIQGRITEDGGETTVQIKVPDQIRGNTICCTYLAV